MDRENYKLFLTPNNTYIPYDNINNLTLRKNNVIYCDEVIGKTNNGVNIYSTISGLIRGTSKVRNTLCEINALVVENDYKDKCFKIKTGKEKFDIYKRKEANELFDSFNINGKFNGKKYLMVDLTIKSDYLENIYLVNEYHYEILETIDAVLTIFNLEKAYIKVNDECLKEILKRYLGIYTNIKLTNSIKKSDNIVNYNGYEIIKIYKALRFNKNMTEKFFTVVNKKQVYAVKTKINIFISELIEYLKVECTNIKVITYENKIIDNYNGLLTEEVKTIVIL